MKNHNSKVCVIGLGYVGLPLLLAFAKKNLVIGFDTNKKRINDLKSLNDTNDEHSIYQLKKNYSKIRFTHTPKDISKCNIYIITVPTPVNKNKKPDLTFIKKATITVSKYLKKNDLIIFESTVYPGLSEFLSKQILEKNSKLILNKDFTIGYSPERINPGDKKHIFEKIPKVVSGSNKSALDKIARLYKTVIKAKIYKAKSIQIAEASKVIENTQRDLNIAFMNELTIIFDKLNLNTEEILKAARTKWNFLDFKPGLVGGHCIGVDPYYLTYISKINNYNPKFILSGRKINNYMPKFIFSKILNYFGKKKLYKSQFKILVMGATFKENCSDIRNSLVFELVNIFDKKKLKYDLYDPHVKNNKKFKFIKRQNLLKNNYDLILFAVNHSIFLKEKISFYKKILKKEGIIFDVKSSLPKKIVTLSL
tara:strand:+ start:7969 stop:9237 length:1269 start_codon:yes stop_codon:yes gene_type:complete